MIKKNCIALALVLGLTGTVVLGAAAETRLYVSPGGSDAQAGSERQPFRTLARAQQEARRLKGSGADAVVVYLRGGRHELAGTLRFTPADSGVAYKAYPGECPVVSGGRLVSGWQVHKGSIYMAPLDYDRKLRSLYVNDRPARMACSKNYIKPKGSGGSFIVTGKEPWAITSGQAEDGMVFSGTDPSSKAEAGLFRNAADIELLALPSSFTQQRVCVREIVKENGDCVYKMQQPGYAFAQYWKEFGFGHDSKRPWRVVNAYELLDEPGEFYFDKAAKTLYYCKSGGEELAEVIAPVLEKLIVFEGQSVSNRVRDVSFEGIAFCHNNFLLMDGGQSGCAELQATAMTVKFRDFKQQLNESHANLYNQQRPMDGAIELYNCENIRFDHCRFEYLTGVGLNLINDTVNCRVSNSAFNYITGAGLGIGHPQHIAIGDGEIFKQGVEGQCVGTVVHNNYFRNVCYEHIFCAAINAFFIADTEITHNDMDDLPYSGMSVGWDWGHPEIKAMKNIKICNNRVTNVMKDRNDGGGIYLLGHAPGSLARGNYIRGAYTSMANGIHPDDSTSGWEITGNVVEKVGHAWILLWRELSRDNKVYGNFADKSFCMLNGTNSYFADNFVEPAAPPWKSSKARRIIEEAGLLPPERYRLAETTVSVIGRSTCREIRLAYCAEKKGTFSILMNNKPWKTIRVKATGGWTGKPKSLAVPVSLEKDSTLTFRSLPGDVAVNLLSVDIGE